MPIQLPNFRALTPQDMGQVDLISALAKGQQFGQNLQLFPQQLQQERVKAQFAEPNAQQALQKAILENKFYGPNIQSEMNLRNAQTGKINTMTPLEAQELKLKNQFYPDLTQAQIENYKALSNFRNLGGGVGGLGVGQKEIAGLQRQLMIDHPDWDQNTANQAASSYLSGNNQLPTGEKLPELSGLGQTFVAQIQKRNSTAAIQNQAANMSILASDINDIDITPLTRFQQLPGRADYLKYKTQMALGQDVPQEFRDYEAFKDVTSNFAMDALRKGFGTSVVPPYVYATLGKAANPASIWWHDPKLVQDEWNKTKEWINNNSKKYTKLGTQGISSNISNQLGKSSSNEPTKDEVEAEMKKRNLLK